MRRFFKIIFQNFPAKIASLLVAIIVWVYVGSGLAQVGSFPGKIPIEFKNIPQGLAAVSDTDSVSVKIVAAANLWRNLEPNSFSATVDVSSFSEGTYELPVKVTNNDTDVRIVEVSPQKIIVRLEKVTEKEIPIILQVEGKAASGLVVGDWKIKPERVKVSGAASLLGKILEATAKVTLNGEKDSLQRIVKVVALDSSGNEIKNLNFTPSEVEAEIPLVQASSAKTVGVKVVTTGQVAEGFWVSGIEAQPSSVAVTASSSLINDISFIETREIDVTGLSQTKEFTTTLNPGVGVNILDNVTLIKAKVIVSPITSTRQLEVGFNWKNLNSNLKVSSVEPSTVTLVVSGSTYDLSKLTTKEISLDINLSAFYQPGTYSVDISRSNVTMPAGVSFSSVVPSAINVKLENR
ncbi:MAG: CdaR family protein [Patescibacteria group bacterium]